MVEVFIWGSSVNAVAGCFVATGSGRKFKGRVRCNKLVFSKRAVRNFGGQFIQIVAELRCCIGVRCTTHCLILNPRYEKRLGLNHLSSAVLNAVPVL